MERQAYDLKVCIDNLCGKDLLKFFANNFNQRLLLQKSTYLLQCWGIDLGFRYNWYIRGPYCPDLTAQAFDISEYYEEYSQACNKLELTESVKQTIEKFKKWISQNKPEGMNSTDWQELLASIHYIQHRTYLEDKNREKVADFLLMKKNWYTKAQVLHAYDVLAKSGLITNEVNTLS
ncbi:MAG: hypothetical protein ACOXZ6_01970 [Syntrophomonadaceae bacterium]